MKKLWLDLGNTRLKYWLTEQGQILEHDAEQHLQAPAELLLGLTDRFHHFQPSFIGVSSVLGNKLNRNITSTLHKLDIPFELVVVDDSHKLMKSNYDQDQLGVDRWLQMLAVARNHPKVCVVGCGTALTIDLIYEQVHQGGYIFPSIYLQRESLQSGTRQISIPDTAFADINPSINTADAVHHGILLSIVGAVNEIVKRYPEHTLIMTGGDASTIANHLDKPAIIHDDLLLQGMQAYFDTH